MTDKLEKHTIYLIVGKSGSGKTTVANLLEKREELKQLPSFTTRPKRKGERDGIGHRFITETEFLRLKHKSKIGAYTFFNGHHYGALIEDILTYDTYVIDVDGVKSLQKVMGDGVNIKVIYINVKSPIMFIRMLKRGDSFIQAIGRILHDRLAFKEAKELSDITINGGQSLDDTYIAVKRFITNTQKGK